MKIKSTVIISIQSESCVTYETWLKDGQRTAIVNDTVRVKQVTEVLNVSGWALGPHLKGWSQCHHGWGKHGTVVTSSG